MTPGQTGLSPVIPAAHNYSAPVIADPGGYGLDTPMPTGYPGDCVECNGFGYTADGGPCISAGDASMEIGALGFSKCGIAEDGCCRPHWFDIYVGPVIFQRDLEVTRVETTSDGIGSGNIVLSTDNLAFDSAPGLQLTAARLVGVGRSAEINFVGLVEWNALAVARSPINNLYSVFSEFGQNPGPPGPGGGPGPGFLDTDQAAEHSLEYSSRFNSFELLVRQRSTTPNCRFHFSHTAGIRYVSLGEDFLHRTNVVAHDDPFTIPVNPNERGPASLTYDIQTENDLLGAQIGASVETCVLPRYRLGGEAKIGLYQNFAEQKTRVICTSCGDSVFHEHEKAEELAGVFEASLYTIFQVSSRLTLRFGYQLLHLEHLTLAPEQFNAAPPNILPPPPGVNRIPFIRKNSNLFIDGYMAGGEWTW